ncbi:MAG: SusD/RagB family nutrient-binding outer membrane lipoprotein [Tannerella sp.]|jgi:hypothetical protein|nr:SusD/RagB family nutrient-binding outer membrane lipoprotein [Tannerella sp.]
MKKYLYKIVCLFLLGLFLSTGCTDKFEEINTDPDNPKEVAIDNLLAWSIWHFSYRFHDRWFMLDEPGSFSGYTSKMAYIDEAKYLFRANVQDNSWIYIYRTLLNLREIERRGAEGGRTNMELAAKTLEINLMQTATDRWRDVPYSDALRLNDEETILSAAYDRQEDIYPALLNMAKEVGDAYAAGSDDEMGGDLLFDGDVSKWQKFVNSLRLRMAIRISEVSPTLARQHVEEILGNPDRYPLIDSNDDNAFFWWDGADPNYYEPIADAYRTRTTEFCASDLMVDHLNQRNDPRIGVYFTRTPSNAANNPADPDYNDGNPLYRGYVIGASSDAVSRLYSIWNTRFGIDLGGFSPYFRAAEVQFHIAEAAMLGYNTGGISAEDAYTQGVMLSMEENGISTADAEAYLDGAGKFDNTKQKIWYEEWVAMFKQGMEGWSLYRRTNTPSNHYIAPGRANRYANHTVPPFRSPYPDRERTLNTDNNAPFNAEVVDDFWGKQMWWDTRTDVH